MPRIKRSQKDINVLREIDLLGVIPSKLDGFDFSETAVVKPWGYEYLVFESLDKSICAWVLHMKNNGQGTSLHCHRNKKTRLIVLEGEVTLKTINQEFTLSDNQEAIIDCGTFHALTALSDPCVIVEVESPSNKPDAVRWKDLWGRERQEYEAQCDLVHTDSLLCPYKTIQDLNNHVADLARETLIFIDS